MENTLITKEAMLIVKDRAKYLGITQSDIAAKLQVSLPTVKRWYSGSGVSLDILKNICNFLGISLTELFSSLEEKENQVFNYTAEQERFFSKNPAYLTFFDYILRGYSILKIQKKFSLSNNEIEKKLAKLEKLGLIDWLPKNKVKIKVKGEPAWTPGGELSKTFRSSIIQSFLGSYDKKTINFYLHDYIDEDVINIKAKINDLLLYISKANKRSQLSPDKSKNYGFFLSMKEFRWNMDDFLEE